MPNLASSSQVFDLSIFFAQDRGQKVQQFWTRVGIACGLPLMFAVAFGSLLAPLVSGSLGGVRAAVVIGVGVMFAILELLAVLSIPQFMPGPSRIEIDENGLTLTFQSSAVRTYGWRSGRFAARIVDLTENPAYLSLPAKWTLDIPTQNRYLPPTGPGCFISEAAAREILKRAAAAGLKITTVQGSAMTYWSTPPVYILRG